MLSSENRQLHYFSMMLHFMARFFLYNLFKVLIVQDDAKIHSLIAHCFTFNDRFGIDVCLRWTFCPQLLFSLYSRQCEVERINLIQILQPWLIRRRSCQNCYHRINIVLINYIQNTNRTLNTMIQQVSSRVKQSLTTGKSS